MANPSPLKARQGSHALGLRRKGGVPLLRSAGGIIGLHESPRQMYRLLWKEC